MVTIIVLSKLNEQGIILVKLNFTYNATHGNLSRTLADTLKKVLVSGQLDIGERLPSNREIAEQAGVSQVTARMAIKRLCNENILETLPGVGTFVKECPGNLTVPAQPGKSRIGVILSPWSSREDATWDYRCILDDIFSALGPDSFQLMIFTYTQWQEYAMTSPETLVTDNKLDSLVWFYNGPQETSFIVQLQQQKFRQLIFKRRQPGIQVPAVLHDESGMVEDVVKHLSDEELKGLMVLSGVSVYAPYTERYDALKTAFEKRKIPLSCEQVIQLPEAPFPSWISRMMLNEVNLRKPSVILDMVGCINLWRSLQSEALASPKLISLFPIDENESGNSEFHYTYYQPMYSYKISKILRDFFSGRAMPKTLYLPFKCCEV